MGTVLAEKIVVQLPTIQNAKNNQNSVSAVLVVFCIKPKPWGNF